VLLLFFFLLVSSRVFSAPLLIVQRFAPGSCVTRTSLHLSTILASQVPKCKYKVLAEPCIASPGAGLPLSQVILAQGR